MVGFPKMTMHKLNVVCVGPICAILNILIRIMYVQKNGIYFNVKITIV